MAVAQLNKKKKKHFIKNRELKQHLGAPVPKQGNITVWNY